MPKASGAKTVMREADAGGAPIVATAPVARVPSASYTAAAAASPQLTTAAPSAHVLAGVAGTVLSEASRVSSVRENVMSSEQVMEIQSSVLRDLVVDVPEKHVLTVRNMIPQFEQVVEEEDVVVPERVTVERCQIEENLIVEATEVDVPVTTTRYQANVKLVETGEHKVDEIEVPVSAPQTTGMTISTDVSIDVNALFLQDPNLIVNYEEPEMVPTVITVPSVNVVKQREETEVVMGVTRIDAIERIERIREVAQTEVVEETVEIPSMSTIHETRHVVKVVDDVSREVAIDPDAQIRAEMHGARVGCQLLREHLVELEAKFRATEQNKLELRTVERQARQKLAEVTEALSVKRRTSPLRVSLSPVRAGAARHVSSPPLDTFDRWDTNRDGVLSPAEFYAGRTASGAVTVVSNEAI